MFLAKNKKKVIFLVGLFFLMGMFTFKFSSAVDFYRINSGQSVVVSDKNITNLFIYDLFIPTRTTTEWNYFLNSLPSGVTSTCQPTYTTANCGSYCGTFSATDLGGNCGQSVDCGICGTGYTCSNHSCVCVPQNGYWSYGSWGSCSATCGPGTRTRTSSCIGASCGGSCVTTPVTSEYCNNGACCTPQDGYWSCGSWGSCSVSCGYGTMYRTCSYVAPSCGGSSVASPITSTSCYAGACCSYYYKYRYSSTYGYYSGNCWDNFHMYSYTEYPYPYKYYYYCRNYSYYCKITKDVSLYDCWAN